MPSQPVQSVLNTLGEDDLEALERLLTDSFDFVDDDSFRRRGMDVVLFGVPAEFSEPTRFVPPAPIHAKTNKGGTVTLSAEDEQTLFLRYNYARMMVAELLTKFSSKRLTAAATRSLLAWSYRAEESRSLIVELNVPLVLAMAKRTRLSSMDFNELISEGNMALLRSVEKFDPSRGFKFSTYACRAILKAFSRVAMRVSRYRGRFPTEFDPAIERSDFLERQREDAEADCIDDIKSILSRNLANLNDVERTVIEERFALGKRLPGDESPKTLEQVGVIIGVTKERVRQIQNKALKKIRNALEDNYLAA